MARIALTPAERQQRSGQLLDAARAIFRETRTLPTVAEIAERAGMAKGSVYLHFRTKEEIFIGLLADRFSALLGALAPVLESLPSDPDAAARHVARHLPPILTGLPELLPLAAMTQPVLEQNLPHEATRQFKQALAGGLSALGRQLEARQPSLADGAGLLLRSWALALGLWQALDCPGALRDWLKQPALQVLDRDYPSELEAALQALWQGALPH